MSILKRLKDSSNTKFVMDWDRGILNETAGAISLTRIGSPALNPVGMKFTGSLSDYFRLGDDSSLELDDFTFVAKVKRDTNTGTLDTIFHCQCSAGGGALAGWYCRFSTLYFQIIVAKDGTTDERLTTTMEFTTYDTYTLVIVKTGTSLKLYVDGVFVKETTLTNATIFYDNAGYSFFGGLSTLGSATPVSATLKGTVEKMIYTGDVLSATEVAQLTAELEFGSHTLERVSSKALSFGDAARDATHELTNGDFDTDTGWVKVNATISGGQAHINSAVDSYLYQANKIVKGRKYRARFDYTLRSGSFYCGENLGAYETFSTVGSGSANFVFTGSGVDNKFIFRKSGVGTLDVDIDNVVLQEVGVFYPDIYFKGEMGAIANEVTISSGFIENTDFQAAGPNSMITETHQNALCKMLRSNGNAIMSDSFGAYGAWHFKLYLVDGGSTEGFMMAVDPTNNTYNFFGKGAAIWINANNILLAFPTVSTHTVMSGIANNTWYDFYVERTGDVWKVYVDGELKLTHTSSAITQSIGYVVRLEANSKLIYASENPELSLYHKAL